MRPALLVIVGTLLIALLLVSSIHPIQPVSSSGSGSGSSQPGTRGNSGQVISSGGGFALFRLPSFNFRFPNLFNFKWPNFNFNFTLPNFNFKWPTINWPSFGSGLGFGSTSLCKNQGICENGSGSGGSGNSSGNSGSSGGQSGSNNNDAVQSSQTTHQPLFKIPEDVIIAIVIIIVIIAGTVIALRSRGAILNRSKRGAQQEQPQQTLVEPAVLLQDNLLEAYNQQNGIEFVGDERISDYQGWGTQGGFIRPGINESLPLIWGLDDGPLEVRAPAGVTLCLGNDTPIRNIAQSGETVVGSVAFSTTCNVIHGLYQGTTDAKWIRAVHYNEDVIKLFRLNFLLGTREEMKNDMQKLELLGAMTPRELVYKIINERPERIKDKGAVLPIARIFERAFYGKKGVSRQEYELFLSSLSKALTDPKVIICGPKGKNISGSSSTSSSNSA